MDWQEGAKGGNVAGFILANFDKIGINFFVFITGLVVGSFLNVCIYRMPREQSVVRPRSHCPHCRKTIKWYDNIPLLSYVALRGKCRYCQTKISLQYFTVELITALILILFYNTFGLTLKSLIYFIFSCGLIIATFVDFNFRIIPDEINIGGIVLGLVISFVYPQLHNTNSHFFGLYRSFLGIIIGGGLLWVTGLIGDFIFKKETMGGGDVKLLAMIGSFLGWQIAVLTFFISPIFGAIVGIIIKLRTKSSLIAYGPYLALGSLVSLFLGKDIVRWVLRY